MKFEEVRRYSLGRVKGVDWLDDATLIVATLGGLYRMDAATFDWTLIAPAADKLSLSADRIRAAILNPTPRRPQVLDLSDGSVVWQTEEPIRGSVSALSLSPDGTRVAYAVGKGEVHVVTVGGDTLQFATEEAFSGCIGIHFLDDGFVTRTSDGVVEVWDANGERRHRWKHHRWVKGLAILPDGRLVLGANPNSAMTHADDIHLWVRELDGTEVAAIPTPNENGFHAKQVAIAVSPDGSRIASAGEYSCLHVVQTSDFTRVVSATLKATDQRRPRKWHGYDAAWSPDGSKIAVLTGSDANVGSASYRHSLQVFDADGNRLGVERAFTGVAHDISVGGDTVAVAHEWGIDLHTGDDVKRFQTVNADAIALSADGTRLVAALNGYNGIVKLYDTADGTVVGEPKVTKESFYRARFAPDNKHYAVAGQYAWACADGRKSAVRCDKSAKDVRGVAFGPNGQFAQCGWDGNIQIGSGKKLATAKTLSTPIQESRRGPKPARAWDCVFSPDGTKLAVACGGQTRIYDLDGDGFVDLVAGRVQACVAWGDGVIATGDREGVLRIWDAASAELVQEFVCGDTVLNVTFGPDGTLYAASEDGVARSFRRTA